MRFTTILFFVLLLRALRSRGFSPTDACPPIPSFHTYIRCISPTTAKQATIMAAAPPPSLLANLWGDSVGSSNNKAAVIPVSDHEDDLPSSSSVTSSNGNNGSSSSSSGALEGSMHSGRYVLEGEDESVSSTHRVSSGKSSSSSAVLQRECV